MRYLSTPFSALRRPKAYCWTPFTRHGHLRFCLTCSTRGALGLTTPCCSGTQGDRRRFFLIVDALTANRKQRLQRQVFPRIA